MAEKNRLMGNEGESGVRSMRTALLKIEILFFPLVITRSSSLATLLFVCTLQDKIIVYRSIFFPLLYLWRSAHDLKKINFSVKFRKNVRDHLWGFFLYL